MTTISLLIFLVISGYFMFFILETCRNTTSKLFVNNVIFGIVLKSISGGDWSRSVYIEDRIVVFAD